MQNFILLNLILGAFLLLSILESYIIPNAKQIAMFRKHFPKLRIITFFTLSILLLILLLVKEHSPIVIYLLFSFGILLFAHALWVTLTKSTRIFFLSLFFAICIIIYRIYAPQQASHNLFLFAGLFWIGGFFGRTGLITIKRFLFLSTLWFAYDATFVWLTHFSHSLQSGTHSIGFPLAISYGTSSIGTGDLLFATLFLGILRTTKQQIAGTLLLIISNLLFGIIAYGTKNLAEFPLLVLWVPIVTIFLGVLLFPTQQGQKKSGNDQRI